MALVMTFRGVVAAAYLNRREWTDRDGRTNNETDRILVLVEDFNDEPRRIYVEDPDLFATIANGGPGQVIATRCDVQAIASGGRGWNRLTLVELVDVDQVVTA